MSITSDKEGIDNRKLLTSSNRNILLNRFLNYIQKETEFAAGKKVITKS